MKFEVEMIKTSGSAADIKNYICKLGLAEKLDLQNNIHFELLVMTLINGGIKKLVLDLFELKYIDSSGIGKIINIAKIMRNIKGKITITRCNPDLTETFKLIKLDSFITFFNSNEEAYNYLQFT